jgi:hypothetical protein
MTTSGDKPWTDAIVRVDIGYDSTPRGPLATHPRPLPGQRKNLFDLRRVAVVHNLHLIDRRPDVADRQPPPARQAA